MPSKWVTLSSSAIAGTQSILSARAGRSGRLRMTLATMIPSRRRHEERQSAMLKKKLENKQAMRTDRSSGPVQKPMSNKAKMKVAAKRAKSRKKA